MINIPKGDSSSCRLSILKGLTSCPCFVDFLRERWTLGGGFQNIFCIFVGDKMRLLWWTRRISQVRKVVRIIRVLRPLPRPTTNPKTTSESSATDTLRNLSPSLSNAPKICPGWGIFFAWKVWRNTGIFRYLCWDKPLTNPLPWTNTKKKSSNGWWMRGWTPCITIWRCRTWRWRRFWISVGKTWRNRTHFWPKQDDSRGKGAKQDAKQDETGRRVEFTSIRLFCVVPLQCRNQTKGCRHRSLTYWHNHTILHNISFQ